MITPRPPTRFLIIQTAFIGDAILATALLEAVFAHYPTARIDLLVRRGNESLFTNHPFLHELSVWDKKKPGGPLAKYTDLARLLTQIRQTRYDAVLNCQRFGATGLLTALSGARVTVGFAKNPFSRLFTHRVDHRIEPGVHEVDRNAGLLNALLPAPIADRIRPRLYPSPADGEAVKIYQTTPYVCMAPTSVWFTKQFPEARWAELIRQLPTHQTAYLLGAPADAPVCARIIDAAGRANVVNLAGKLTLLQSAALMRGAAMNYVNDSAPLHLASAMNAPITAIFCSTVPEFGFGPLSDNSRVWQTPELLECRPCGLHGKAACPLGHFRCAWGVEII
jgi:ADP-heptose:LPS heptosyltransferase